MSRASYFWPKFKDGKPHKVVILDSAHDPSYDTADAGKHIVRFSSGTPLYKRGDWVLWKQDGNGRGRIARVSRVDRKRGWGDPIFHLRLLVPVEGLFSRRRGYDARTQELQALDAVSALAEAAKQTA